MFAVQDVHCSEKKQQKQFTYRIKCTMVTVQVFHMEQSKDIASTLANITSINKHR